MATGVSYAEMEEVLDRVRRVRGDSVPPPVDAARMQQARKNRDLPEELVKVYDQFDGISLRDESTRDPSNAITARLVGISETEAAREMAHDPDGFGLLPLERMLSATDEYQLEDKDLLVIAHSESDPFVLFGGGPLAGYLARLRHDGDDTIEHRTLEDYLIALCDAIEAGKRMPGHVEKSLQPEPADEEKGRQAVDGSIADTSDAACRRLRLATQLLGDRSADLLLRLVEHEDWYVQEAAEARLAQLPGQQAQNATRWIKTERAALETRCSELLKAAHSPIGMRSLNLRAFWSRRSAPDFDDWFMGHFRDR